MATMSMHDALATGRVTFTDSWLRDCLFYICNNHVLLSVFLAHPEHPYPRLQRGLVLFNSLSFAFFVTAVLHVFVPLDIARAALHATIGTLLQLAFDIPASMLGTCPCAHPCLPPLVRGCCRGCALAFLSVHTIATCVFALLGVVVLSVSTLFGDVDAALVWDGFLETKLNAFVGALPWAVLVYALVRQCEAADHRVRGGAPMGVPVREMV